MSPPRRYLNFANVISFIALFVALGGGSYAAVSNRGDGGPAAAPGQPSQPLDQTAQDGQGEGSPSPEATSPAPEQGNAAPSTVVPEEPAPAEGGDSQNALPPEVGVVSEGEEAPARAQGDRGKVEEQDADPDAGGPPPWAPARGFRCKQAGNAPGSDAFHRCIASNKP